MLREKWSKTCEQQRVSRSNDGSDFVKNVVPWTLNSETIREFDRDNGMPQCKNVQELTKTISLSLSNYTCQIPWVSNKDLCSLFDQYSMVFWYGDSLTRHMTQSLHMLFNQDMQYGGYPPREPGKDIPYKYCSCDGQFSESRMCRNFKHDFSFTNVTAKLGACQSPSSASQGLPPTEFISRVENGRLEVPNRNMFIPYTRSPASVRAFETGVFTTLLFTTHTHSVLCPQLAVRSTPIAI